MGWYGYYPQQVIVYDSMGTVWENPTHRLPVLKQSMSALVGDLDLYPQVFQIQNAIPGSVWVLATGWLGAISQNLRGSQALVGSQVLSILNRNKLVNCKHQYVEQNTFKTSCHTCDRTKYGLIGCVLLIVPSIHSLPLIPTPIWQKHCKL